MHEVRVVKRPEQGQVPVWDGRQWVARAPARQQVERLHTSPLVQVMMGGYRSPDYKPGVAGWALLGDGSLEANNITARGTVYATAGEVKNLTVTGLLSMSTAGELRAGADANNGIRFGYLTDGYYVRGVKAGVTQFEIRASDGAAVAGGGGVVLDASGVVFEQDDAGGYIRFSKTGVQRGYVRGRVDGGFSEIMVRAGPPGGTDTPCVVLEASTDVHNPCFIAIAGRTATMSNPYIGFYPDGSVVAFVHPGHLAVYGTNDLRVGGGLYVGSHTIDPDEDDVHIDGSINKSTALGCRAIRTATQSLTSGALTALSFNSEVHDTDGGFTPTSTRLYARTAGYYLAGCSVALSAPGSAISRKIALLVKQDGAQYLAESDVYCSLNVAAGTSVITGMCYMAVNEYVEFYVYHDTGINLNSFAADVNNQHYCNGWLVRVA